MKVLVTGGTGYIGSHTAVELLDRDYNVVMLDNLCNSEESVIEKIANITGKRPRFYKADLMDEKALGKIFEKEKFDAVIHFAGLKAVAESVDKPLKYYENNVKGSINLLKVMNKYGVKKIVFSSSACVYGDQPAPYVETMPVGRPTNPYGMTKLMVEQVLMDACASDKEFTAIILRYFNPIGAHESGLIGENPRGIPNNLAPYILQVATGQRECLSVYGNDYKTHDGTGVRDYIHVVDLAVGHIAALEKCDKGVSVYNLGMGKGLSVLEVHSAFENAVGKKIPYKFAPRRLGDLDAFWADAGKAWKELGWVAKLDIHKMCEDSWRFISACKGC